MIANMNHEEFEAKLKEMIWTADWHQRYYKKLAARWDRRDYWLKATLGTLSIAGAAMVSSGHASVYGAWLAAGSAAVLGALLPNYKWDAMISGLKDERDEWIRIFQGYEGLQSMFKILERDEMLTQEWQKVEELRKATEATERGLPEDEKLLLEIQKKVEKYHDLMPSE